jgi:hypothetical protein
MTPRRILPKFQEEQASLGLPTIMDRALAAAHGARYVHLAVFAIDIDRAYWLDPERSDLPFGWEVFVTECHVLGSLLSSQQDGTETVQRELLEAVCMDVMDETPGEPPLGGQLVFAVYDAVQRKLLPTELRALFAAWHSPPAELRSSLDKLWSSAQPNLVELAKACLAMELEPPLAPPTVIALQAMASGRFAFLGN